MTPGLSMMIRNHSNHSPQAPVTVWAKGAFILNCLLLVYCLANLYSLAYVEMRLILARMVWNFDMELQEDSRRWNEGQKVFLTWVKDSLNVRLVPVVR